MLVVSNECLDMLPGEAFWSTGEILYHLGWIPVDCEGRKCSIDRACMFVPVYWKKVLTDRPPGLYIKPYKPNSWLEFGDIVVHCDYFSGDKGGRAFLCYYTPYGWVFSKDLEIPAKVDVTVHLNLLDFEEWEKIQWKENLYIVYRKVL